jgi:glycine cleavage system transcriptional repressor
VKRHARYEHYPERAKNVAREQGGAVVVEVQEARTVAARRALHAQRHGPRDEQKRRSRQRGGAGKTPALLLVLEICLGHGHGEAAYARRVRHFAVSAIGRDRPGIVAAISEVLLAHQGNIEDSQMTILRGNFTVMLIVTTPDDVEADVLRTGLEEAGARLGLEAMSLGEITEGADACSEASAEPSHIVSVYGADHPGIVHDVTSALARQEVNITDLTTRLIEGGESPLYAMMLEIALPPSRRIEEVGGVLRDVGKRQGVELSIRPLERDAL